MKQRVAKMMFEKPIICTTARWQRTAWTQTGLNDLRKCAKHQNFKMTEVVGETPEK